MTLVMCKGTRIIAVVAARQVIKKMEEDGGDDDNANSVDGAVHEGKNADINGCRSKDPDRSREVIGER